MKPAPQNDNQTNKIPKGQVTPGVKCVFMIVLFPFQAIWVLLSELFYRPVKVIQEQCIRGDDLTKILVGVFSPLLYVFSMMLSMVAAPTIICYNLCAYLNEPEFSIAIKKFFWYEGPHCVDYLCYGEAGAQEHSGQPQSQEMQRQNPSQLNGIPVNQNPYVANPQMNNYNQPQYQSAINIGVQQPHSQNPQYMGVKYKGDNKCEAICYWIFCKK